MFRALEDKMKRMASRTVRGVSVAALAAMFLFSGGLLTAASAQSKPSPAAAQVTAEQQKQIDRLKQLSEQLQKDRDAVHQAISEYGVDSEQADAAQERLIQDRQEYRNLKRSLRTAGVAVPETAGPGLATGGPGDRPGRHCQKGHGHHGCCGDGECCRGQGSGCCCCRHGM
jgi:uncharacterized protein YlxW (UPF0749 family)